MENHDKIVLLVEDNPDDEMLTLLALRKNNISSTVVVAHDGVEALDFVFGTGNHEGRDLRVQPQVILLDLKLPRLSGIEVLERLRNHDLTKLIPVVVLTSSNEQRDLVACYGLCANSYIRKPVDFTHFSRVVAELGTYWLGLNEVAPVPA